MATIILSSNAEKELIRLNLKDKKKVIKKIHLLEDKPFAGKLLSGKLKGNYSLRAWPYRTIYELKKPDKVIIHHILHRQKAY